MNGYQTWIEDYFRENTIQLDPIQSLQTDFYANKLDISLGNISELQINNITQPILLSISSEWINFFKDTNLGFYDKNNKRGFWDCIFLKINTKRDLLIKIIVHGNNWREILVENYFNDFINNIDAKYTVHHKSIYIQWTNNNSHPRKNVNTILFYGSPCIDENILGINFILKPDTFSQTNPFIVEPLYKAIHQYIEPYNEFICYGRNFGHIFFTLDRSVILYAYDTCELNMQDLQQSYYQNSQIKAKVEFNLDKDHQLIFNMLSSYKQTNTNYIIFTSNGCLDSTIIYSLKNNHQIKKICYITCNHKAFCKDLDKLNNFYISKIQYYDLLPNTAVFGIIAEITFDR